MEIVFDPAKNERNIAQRGLSFELAAEVDWQTAQIREDTRRDYGETRLFVLGMIHDRLHALVICLTRTTHSLCAFRRAGKTYESSA
jgi:uncharacterized protein